MTKPIVSALDRRAAVQTHAANIGITEAFISDLVDAFYAEIRSHPLIGPIFENAIGSDWSAHLLTMKKFWGSVTLHTGAYSGKPVPAHRKLTDTRSWHFNIWLSLFQQTLDDTAPNETVKAYFLERAERIANNLHLAMFGSPNDRATFFKSAYRRPGPAESTITI